MEVPIARPKPSYPKNFTKLSDDSSTSAASKSESSILSTSRKNSSGSSRADLGGNRSQSYLSLASLNLAHSTSSLLGIFSSALDSVPPTPISTPPPASRREREVIEEVDKWVLTKDVVWGATLLFTLGYAFAL